MHGGSSDTAPLHIHQAVIYTDFLSLARLEDDAWRVVSKIFAPRPLSARCARLFASDVNRQAAKVAVATSAWAIASGLINLVCVITRCRTSLSPFSSRLCPSA